MAKVTWNEPPGSSMPESNRPSGAPGDPDVTVCGSPANVQRTTSPSLTVRLAGSKRKFTDATVTVAAFTEPIAPSSIADTTTTAATRRGAGRRGVRGLVTGTMSVIRLADGRRMSDTLETDRARPSYG